MKPNVPTLSRTPTSSTAPPVGASAPASGSQVWNGNSGALIANAMKKPRKSHFSTPGLMCRVARVAKSKVPPPGSCWPDTTYRPITEASINRPPSRL